MVHLKIGYGHQAPGTPGTKTGLIQGVKQLPDYEII
jgi:hypothetical protein